MARGPFVAMRKTLNAYFHALFEVGRLRIAGAIGLMLLFSLSEGLGIALLLPILQVSGFNLGAQGAVGRYANALASGLAAVGLCPSLLPLLMVFASLVGARALLGRWQLVVMFSVQQNFGVLMRQRLYRAIANTDWLALSRMRASDLTHALTAEIDRIEGATFGVMSLASATLLFLLYLGIALAISAPMTALALGSGIVLVALMRGRTALLRGAGIELSERTKGLYGATVEHLQSLKAAKMYGVQERNAESYAALSRAVARANVEIERQQAANSSLFEIGSVVILAAVLYVSVSVLGVAPFAVLLLLAMFARVIPRIIQCHHLYQECLHAMPAFENVIALAGRCAAMAEPVDAPAQALGFENSLRLEAVSFSYRRADAAAPAGQPAPPTADGPLRQSDDRMGDRSAEPPAVHDLDLTVPVGQVVALVGPSGAGKSTIADLMTGLLVPDSGRVTVDGVSLDATRARGWREQVGYVSQDTYLFHDTVRANLLWARPGASEAAMREALGQAAAESFVDALPNGLDTVIGDRGASISHGERQRLALARALLRHPRLLIMDEATNSLDAHNEQRILDTIERLRGDLTIVMIAHRIAAVRRADRIYVVEGGTIVESGSWNELCAREHGRFRALCESQGIAPVPLAPPLPPIARRLA
jgi:ATP-binding cassette, subfamily C, bacterial